MGRRDTGVRKMCPEGGSEFGLLCGCVGEDLARPGQERSGGFVALRSKRQHVSLDL